MAAKKRSKKLNRYRRRTKERKFSFSALPQKPRRWILGILMFLTAAIISLSFFNLAGIAGESFVRFSSFLIGKTVFILPLLLILGGLMAFCDIKREKVRFQGWLIVLTIFFLILGIAGSLTAFTLYQNIDLSQGGGWLGYLIAFPILKFFGFWAAEVIFLTLIFIGFLIFFYFLSEAGIISFKKDDKEKEKEKEKESKPTFIRKIFGPKFKIKEIPSSQVSLKEAPKLQKEPLDLFPKTEKNSQILTQKTYSPPPINLLKGDGEVPNVGDIRENSAVIKKTLQDFEISVEMSEVNIGPTVTQYTLKPAEGVKLSKITTLSNDLALALAAPSIRIEAPIPGKSLVGIEVPNKSRVLVKLKNLIESSVFQNSPSNLTITLGKDVSGFPVLTDLARMPHLLVAGSTGSGKTICLNSIILNLIYQNSPENLKLLLIDPKRVEFSVYNDLPHLLTPVIFNAQKTVNALKWLISEMERRFEVLSKEKARNIFRYNEIAVKDIKREIQPLPYIIVIIDELADLMAAKGREVEAGIVRLSQMARAVGIHLIVATQRPSVEVITGLIKANITSRVSFQVASQVDSRTILDVAGAEKLLGEGDMLFISAAIVKPKRIQAPYVSEKEVKEVVKYLKKQNEERKSKEEVLEDDVLSEELEKTLEAPETELKSFYGGEDSLYEEAKKVVFEARKASASLLQRRLSIGYARAARLLDILEDKGVVGPSDGAKPREVYIKTEEDKTEEDIEENIEEEKTEENTEEENKEEGWEKI